MGGCSTIVSLVVSSAPFTRGNLSLPGNAKSVRIIVGEEEVLHKYPLKTFKSNESQNFRVLGQYS